MDVYLFCLIGFFFSWVKKHEGVGKQAECFLLFRGYVIQYRFLIGMLSWPCLHDIHQFFIYAHHSLSLINVPVSYMNNIDLSVPINGQPNNHTSYKQTNKQQQCLVFLVVVMNWIRNDYIAIIVLVVKVYQNHLHFMILQIAEVVVEKHLLHHHQIWCQVKVVKNFKW